MKRMIWRTSVAMVILTRADAAYSQLQLPVVVVEASYPGANATVVADSVAAPIEQQVFGAENCGRLESRCTDGHYFLAVALKPDADPKAAFAAVRERVALAEPILPEEIRRRGVTIGLKTPTMLIATLASVDGAYDATFLSDYASRQIKDELARLPGVGNVALLGGSDPRIYVRLDPDRLTAFDLSASDVGKALQEWKPRVGASHAIVNNLRRHSDLAPLGEFVVKATPEGRVVRLNDVGRIEIGTDGVQEIVRINGERCVALGISMTVDVSSTESSRVIESKLKSLRVALPDKMRLDFSFKLDARLAPNRIHAAEFLMLELQLPEGASREEVVKRLTGCEATLRGVPTVKDLLTLTSNPLDMFANGSCILIRLSPATERTITLEEIERMIRAKSETATDASTRLRTLERDHGRSLDFAVYGEEPTNVRTLAKTLAERLSQAAIMTDVQVDRAADLKTRIDVEIDRAKAKELGVALDDVARNLDIAIGKADDREIEAFGSRMKIVVHVDGALRDHSEALKRLAVRNDKGLMIPLATLASFRMVAAPASIDRIDMKPAVRLSARAAESPNDVHKKCEAHFKAVRSECRLSDAYSLTWLAP